MSLFAAKNVKMKCNNAGNCVQKQFRHSVAQLGAVPTGNQEVAGSNPAGSPTFCRRFDREIFSTVILSLPLTQEGQ